MDEKTRKGIAKLIADHCEETAEGAIWLKEVADSIIDPVGETTLFLADQILAYLHKAGYRKVEWNEEVVEVLTYDPFTSH